MKEYKLIFSIYLSILFVFIVFFLSAVHNSPVNNSMHEWVINYQGGFTRRGFLGEIVFEKPSNQVLSDDRIQELYLGKRKKK